jgi:hypothetical protein
VGLRELCAVDSHVNADAALLRPRAAGEVSMGVGFVIHLLCHHVFNRCENIGNILWRSTRVARLSYGVFLLN